MAPVSGKKWSSGYGFCPFNVTSTDVDFSFSRKSAGRLSGEIKGSNLSAVWIPYEQERLINGTLQGHKQGDPKGASTLSRRKMTELVCTIAALRQTLEVEDVTLYDSYKTIKTSLELRDRRLMKAEVTREALKGWVKGTEDNFDIEFEHLHSIK